MKSATSFFVENHRKNLSTYIRKLIHDRSLNERLKDLYVLTREARLEIAQKTWYPIMNQLSVLPVHSPSTMSPDEARWAAFVDAAGMPYQYKPLMFMELPDTGPTRNRHAPCFLVQCRKPFWLEVLPALEADVLPAYDEVLHFARTIVMVQELERSEYWPGSVFAAFGRQHLVGLVQRKAKTPAHTQFSFLVRTKIQSGQHLRSVFTSGPSAPSTTGLPRVWTTGTLIGDWTGSVMMSCCGQIFDDDPANRPVRSSKKLRRAVAAANRVIVPNKGWATAYQNAIGSHSYPEVASPSEDRGNHTAWFLNCSGVQFSHTSKSSSITDPKERDEGIRIRPGDSSRAMNFANWTSMVLTSADTRTRHALAASLNTSGSGVPSGITPKYP